MTHQIKQLRAFIKENKLVTYDAVKNKAKYINPYWRSETWRRGLRPSDSPMIESVKSDKGIIIGYKYKEVDWHDYDLSKRK